MPNAFAKDARFVTHQINQAALPHPSVNALSPLRQGYGEPRDNAFHLVVNLLAMRDTDAPLARRKVTAAE